MPKHHTSTHRPKVRKTSRTTHKKVGHKKPHKKSHTTSHKKPHHLSRSKIYIQDIMGKSSRLTPRVSGACRRSAFGSRSSFSSETPKEKAIPCAGGLRLGRTGKYVYASVSQFKRSVHRPRGYRSFAWKKVYDKKTGKPFDVMKFLKSRGVTDFYRHLIS